MVDAATSVVLIPAEVAERRGRSYSPLAVQLLDTERAADTWCTDHASDGERSLSGHFDASRLLEELGADHCRRLALALLALVREVTR